MTGITRRQGAEALGTLFGTQFRYLGGTYKVYEVPDRGYSDGIDAVILKLMKSRYRRVPTVIPEAALL
jgi:hypothetical protein